MINFLRRYNLSIRLLLLAGVFASAFLAYGVWSFRTLDQLKVNGPLYRDIVASKDLVADALPPSLYVIESYLFCLQADVRGDGASFDARFAQLREHHRLRLRQWQVQVSGTELAPLLATVGATAQRFFEVATAEFQPALHARDVAAKRAAQLNMDTAFEQHRAAVDALVGRASGIASSEEAHARTRIAREAWIQLAILAMACGLGLAVAVVVRRSITAPLTEALDLAGRVAAGDMNARPHDRHADEPGRLLDALESMRASLARMLEQRSAAEQSLRQAKELTEKLIDSANVIVVGLDRAGRVVVFNRTASRLTGYPAADILGRRWRDMPLLGAAGSRWPAEDGWDRSATSDEHSIVAADGEQRWIAWQNTVLGHEGGEVALISFGIDITAQRAAMEATVHAQEAAEAATRSKSEFLANMSHEIRTPMNAVIGMTRLALMTGLDDRQRNYLEKADHAAHGLLAIINDILDFSKIEAGKLRFEEQAFQLRAVLDQLAALTVLRAQEKGLELLFDLAPDVPLDLVGDPLRLGQVLLNLVNNAIKFTEHGNIIVSARLLARQDDGVELQVDVRDTGIGFAPEQAARLFKAFSQADASTTRTHGGTGLGLSISRSLVELMGGRIWADSTPGTGSCFSFTARFGIVAAGAGSTLPLSLPVPANMRVLVVDDNAAAREIIGGILASIHLAWLAVDSAEAAIVELERAVKSGQPYQLVMMDWVMPTMDGVKAIRAIRSNPAIPSTLSIIMVTAYSRDELLGQAADLEALDVLEKPVTPSSVFDAIAGALRDHERRALVPPAPAGPRPQSAGGLDGASILLVEDNAVNQEVADNMLRLLGVKVTVAFNGEEALALLESTRFDAVLMDCQMPVMDGYEATRRMRSDVRFARLPVLAMTANAMSGDEQLCREAGMDAHIPKPIEFDLLAETLEHWIAPARARDAASGPGSGYAALRAAMVDVDAGLQRADGHAGAFEVRLLRFQQAAAAFSEQVDDALAVGQHERARHLGHRLYSEARQIGADELAGLLEPFMQPAAGTPPPAAPHERLTHALAAVSEAIGRTLAAGGE